MYKAMSRVRWYFNCRDWAPSEQEWVKAMACIQEEESERINKFVFRDDAKLSLAGRILARTFLCEAYSLNNSSLNLQRSYFGKPFVVDTGRECSRIDFSISHQGKYVILAGDVDCLIGADVMDIDQTGSSPDLFHIMRRQFNPREWEYIKSPDQSHDQLARFYRFWCLKESYVKALGRGIGFGVGAIDCRPSCNPWTPGSLTTDTYLVIRDNDTRGEWIFEESFLDYKHCVAVAVKPLHTKERSVSLLPFVPQYMSDCLSSLEPIQTPSHTNWDMFTHKQDKCR